MDEECKDECCGKEDEHDMPKMIMCMAHDAWNELMLDKMKAAFDEKRGKHMDAAAKLAVEHSILFWSSKMKGKEITKEDHEEFEKKLMEIFKSE